MGPHALLPARGLRGPEADLFASNCRDLMKLVY